MAMDQALCVCEVADVLEMPQSSVSSHVQQIRRAGLIESEKREKWTFFRVLPAYRALLLSLEKHFPNMPEEWRDDEERLRKRLAERDQSCCPSPERLAPSRSSRTKALRAQ